MSMTIQYGHPDDVSLKASPTHWKDFMRSVVWEDMKNFYEDRMRIIQKEIMVETDIDRIRQKQMEAQACQLALELPKQMLEWAEDEQLKGGSNGSP